MSDPRRLMDDPSELTEEELRLLTAGLDAAPPSALGADVWAGLAAKLPPSGGGGSTGTGAGASAAPGVAPGVGALLIKAGLAVLALGALWFGGRALIHRDATSALVPVVASAVPLASAPPVVVSPMPEAPLPAATPPVLHAAPAARASSALRANKAVPLAPSAAPRSSSASDASEESRMVAAARDALRAGSPNGALALLGQTQRRFGGGVLGQEREALAIEALAKSGQQSAAHARGEAFLKDYAHSPYAARIRALIGAN